MRTRMKTILAIVAVVAAVAAAYAVWNIVQTPSIEIHSPSARWSPQSISISLTIHNHGLGEDCLVAARVVSPFNAVAEIHRMVMSNGTAVMQPVASVCVPGRSELVMNPAVGEGYHIMIMGNFSKPPEKLMLVLHFAKTGDLALEVPVGQAEEGASRGH